MLTSSFFSPAFTLDPCLSQTPSTSHWEIFSTLLKCLPSGYVFVTSPDWSPHTVGLRLVVPWSLPTWFVFCRAYSGSLERDQEPDLHFLLVLLQQKQALIYVTAATFSCSHEALRSVIKPIGVTGRKFKIQSIYLCELKPELKCSTLLEQL